MPLMFVEFVKLSVSMNSTREIVAHSIDWLMKMMMNSLMMNSVITNRRLICLLAATSVGSAIKWTKPKIYFIETKKRNDSLRSSSLINRPFRRTVDRFKVRPFNRLFHLFI